MHAQGGAELDFFHNGTMQNGNENVESKKLEGVELLTVGILVGAMLLMIPLSNAGDIAIACLWMGFGHATLHFLGLYPKHNLRAIPRGVLAYALGMIWPVWVVCYRDRISI